MAEVPYPCIICNIEVRPRQEALQCEGCDRWQHKKCNSGITQDQYCQAVNNKSEIDWKCTDCSAQLHSFHHIILDPNITADVSSFLPPVNSTHLDLPPSPYSSTTDSSIASLAELMATDMSFPSELFNADSNADTSNSVIIQLLRLRHR